MRKILFIGLVITAVVLVSGCYAPTTSPNATVQPTGGTEGGMVTPVTTPVETYITTPAETITPVMTTTSVGISSVTGTPYATGTGMAISTETPYAIGTGTTTGSGFAATPVSTGTGTSPTVVTGNTVNITSAGYDPAIITVPRGTMVTWTNTDTVSHTVTSTTGAFSSSLASGETYSYTFNTPGSYDYGDSSNPKMSGTVIVT